MIRRLCGLLALLAFAASATAQTSQFKYEPSRVPVGTAMHYRKSNLDGTHLTRVSVYVADLERLETLKWDDGGVAATLVQARMDWSRFSVSKLKSWRLQRGAPPELRSALEASADGSEVRLSFADSERVKVDRWPWHSYDVDFASLGMTLPHLRDPTVDVIFWRADVVGAGERKHFAQLGGVRLHFEAADTRNGREVRLYSIGGAGLRYLYGKLWTDADSGMLVGYEIPVGDESGYRDVRLQLERTELMTPEQWQLFKKTRVGDKS